MRAPGRGHLPGWPSNRAIEIPGSRAGRTGDKDRGVGHRHTQTDLRFVLDLAAAGKVRCRIEAQPLAHINSVLEQMHKGAITARVVLTPGTSGL